jgi:hypothetical protein
MRKLSAVLLLLLFSSLLYAQTYRSNQLLQRLEELDSVPAQGYALDVNGDESTLYLDGRAVIAIAESNQGDERIIEQKELESGNTKTLVYRDGLLVQESLSSDGITEESIYTYIRGHLAFCTIRRDGQTLDVIFFLRSADGNEPVAVKDNDGLRFMSSSYMFQSGELYQIISSDLVLTGDYKVQESGEIVVELEDGTYTYSEDGLLLKLVQGASVTTNTYEGRQLVKSETVTGENRKIVLYEGGSEHEILDYEGAQLISRTLCRKEGNIQTLYRNGREIAVVYYNADNRTVERIEYR